ncbi:DUF3347 domain-containing protein [Ferruginibacter sp.]|nr:DUF3347 domain-containing protein [Ferruginibacter sp.]
MKKILFSVALFATALVQQSFAQETSKAQPSPLLTSYYNLKDALVSSNATAAAASSAAFVKALNDIDKETLKDESRNALLTDANAISLSKDLKLQREKFATLSTNMFALAKTVKLSADPVYQQYCPMKKASWLSDNKAIKNPYYGSAMLTCGSVKQTL